jgi:glycosyltransferase involved in cell wall biosynthesis
MERHRVGIVIPALNEEATINSVVSSVKQYGIPIVVDDGSCDKTGELAVRAGASVVRHEVNRGYDNALNSGFQRAVMLGCEYVVTVDADGQHDSSIIEPFIRGLDDGADVVVGMRDRLQRFAEHLFAWISSMRWDIHDPLCGMKGYRLELYRHFGHFDSYGSIGTEFCLRAAKNGNKIVQIPVRTHERIGTPRFGGRLKANMRILNALMKGIWRF